MRFWHKYILGHELEYRKVTIGMFDSSKGYLVKCSCGEYWAI